MLDKIGRCYRTVITGALLATKKLEQAGLHRGASWAVIKTVLKTQLREMLMRTSTTSFVTLYFSFVPSRSRPFVIPHTHARSPSCRIRLNVAMLVSGTRCHPPMPHGGYLSFVTSFLVSSASRTHLSVFPHPSRAQSPLPPPLQRHHP